MRAVTRGSPETSFCRKRVRRQSPRMIATECDTVLFR
jgi:hypothetical protein